MVLKGFKAVVKKKKKKRLVLTMFFFFLLFFFFYLFKYFLSCITVFIDASIYFLYALFFHYDALLVLLA